MICEPLVLATAATYASFEVGIRGDEIASGTGPALITSFIDSQNLCGWKAAYWKEKGNRA